jgi:hypothetical protein
MISKNTVKLFMTLKKMPKIKPSDLTLPPTEPSLLYVQQELQRSNGINFEQWWDEFRHGFRDGKRDKSSNFLAGLWTKPKYANITPTTSTNGAITIEYWPESDNTTESYLLSGTVSDLISGIMDIMRQKKARETQGSDRNDDIKMLSKHPKIYLFFKEKRTDSGARPKQGRISFRIMNETEDTLSIAGLKKLAAKINSVFGGKPPYSWVKGKSYMNYNHWELGYKLQLLSPSSAQGQKLIQDILKIQDHVFDKARMTVSKNQDEAKAFPSKPRKRKVLGEEVSLPMYRPNCEVQFQYAAVETRTLESMVVILSLNGRNPIDSRFKS